MVKSIPQLSLKAIYPHPTPQINMNTCGDVDCGNYGVAPNFSLPVFKGSGAAQRKLLASVKIPALAMGLGGYSLTSDSKKSTISKAFEYQNDPRAWDDGREIECHHQKGNGQPKSIRQHYTRKSSGKVVSAPKLHFQRPSGRFDEAAFFASVEGSWRVFSDRIERAYEDDIAAGLALLPDIQGKLDDARDRRELLDQIRNGYFGFGDVDRDFRGSFKGIIVKPTYTKAAHLACIQEMLPVGKITLVGEREAAMGRVVPHIFRDMIQADLFEWLVIAFDKEASTPKSQSRIKKFEEAFEVFASQEMAVAGKETPRYELLRRYCSNHLEPAVKWDRQGNALFFATANFKSAQFPQFWAASPVQHFGETEKVVGFPIIREKYRKVLRRVGFDQDITDTDLRDALARRVLYTTIQPVSSFMNSLRTRISPTKRAGGKSARNGPSYINGAVFNPAVLVAILNIYRVYYNWFEARQYVGPGSAGKATSNVEMGLSSVRVPGSLEVVQVPNRRSTAPVMRTPAMRLGAADEKDKAPDPRRVLYRPWLFHGTPLWRKFETR